MRIVTKSVLAVMVVLGLVLLAAPAVMADSASPKEVVQKVDEAAKFLAGKGEAGLAQFNDKNGPWVFKDTYVFVFDCTGKQSLVAHVVPAMIGKDLNTLQDPQGRNLGTLLCGAAMEHPGGSWVEYTWPKVVEGGKKFVRKISYIKKVPGTNYEVGAGVYNEKVPMAELNKLIQ